MLHAAVAIECERPSTVEQFVAKIGNQKVREGFMSIAEQLIQEGEQRGLEKGRQEARSMAEQLIREGEQRGLEKGRQEARSMAEQLTQESEQRGLERGRLEGRIQLCQQLLGLSMMSSQELRSKESSELEELLGDLKGRLRQWVK